MEYFKGKERQLKTVKKDMEILWKIPDHWWGHQPGELNGWGRQCKKFVLKRLMGEKDVRGNIVKKVLWVVAEK